MAVKMRGKPRMIVLIVINILGIASGATVLSPNVIKPSQIVQPGGCTLTLPKNRNYAPAVTDLETSIQLVPIQNKDGLFYLKIEQDRKIKLNCGRGNPLNSDHSSSPYLRLSCVRGSEFVNDDDEQLLLPEGIECSNARKPTPIVYRNGSCPGKGTNFDVEFVNESPPRKFYSTCLNEETSGALYSSSYIDGKSFANGEQESSGNRPDFRGHEFYPFPIKQVYKWENAFEHLSELIGSPQLVAKYFPTDQYRFSRGHLFPNADGVKRFEKQATFYYINTVPQWQLLNGGTWAHIEEDVRNLAKSVGRTLNIVTGAFGVTTLKDTNNNDVEIYLARDETGKLRLPVPRLVWKVVHDPVGNSAVAIVQVNNPWADSRSLRERDVLCNDLCSSLPWLRSSDFHKPKKGYTYCCDVKELRRAIPYIPDMKYSQLLNVNYADANRDSDSEYDDDDDDSEEDELDGSSSSSSESGSAEVTKYHKNHKLDLSIENISELFANIRLG